MINLSGSELIKNSNDVQVDKEGNIFIKGVGIIPAKGRTVSSVEKSIMSGVSAKFDSIKVKVVVADSGKFPVIVTGNVKYPGTVFLNTRSTILDALNFAGGIQKNGSLREIIYINSKTKKRITVDLYALILNGNYSQITFGESDFIFVNPVKSLSRQHFCKTYADRINEPKFASNRGNALPEASRYAPATGQVALTALQRMDYLPRWKRSFPAGFGHARRM